MSAAEQSLGRALESQTLAQVEALARRIALQLAPGDALALTGDLGTGKTAFARALIQSIAPGPPEVASPTYLLMQSYPVTLAGGAQETLWHLDLYRLESISEAQELGLEEIWPHIAVVEWPERIAPLLPRGCLHIAFAYAAGEGLRRLTVSADDAWRARWGALW